MTQLIHASHPALVARQDVVGLPASGRYLQLAASGDAGWTNDPTAATAFESMREAMRAATRLPCALRAFGIPRQAELMVAGQLN